MERASISNFEAHFTKHFLGHVLLSLFSEFTVVISSADLRSFSVIAASTPPTYREVIVLSSGGVS